MHFTIHILATIALVVLSSLAMPNQDIDDLEEMAAVNLGVRYHKRSVLRDNYALVVDAGSTGSRLRVYRWRQPVQSQELPDVTLTSSTKYEPALGELQDNLTAIRPYLKTIVDKAMMEVPADQYASTPITLMATAGLRFFSSSESKAMMDEIRTLLSDPTFSPFAYHQKNIQVISGDEEGVYAWITLNYLRGYFNGTSTETFGVVELGGGSMQIAFIPEGPNYAGEFQVILEGRLCQIYVHSYLDFGSNGIQRQILNKICQSNSTTPSTVDNPCFLKGDRRTITREDGVDIVNIGTGDPFECSRLLTEVLMPSTGIACQPKPCAVRSVYQPLIGNRKFAAIPGWTFTVDTVGGLRSDGTLDLADLYHSAVNDYCNKTFAEAIAEGISAEYASSYCLNAQYMKILFNGSFGFPMDTTNIVMAADIDGQSIDWSLGALLLDICRSHSLYPPVVRKRRSLNFL